MKTENENQKEGVLISLTPEKSEEYFLNALCNGIGYMQGYGLTFDLETAQDYKEAKESFKVKNPGRAPCIEDVWMEGLRMGKKFVCTDEEGGEDSDQNKSITLKDVHERVVKMEGDYLMDYVLEQDDADTADVLIQTVFFEEIIFG